MYYKQLLLLAVSLFLPPQQHSLLFFQHIKRSFISLSNDFPRYILSDTDLEIYHTIPFLVFLSFDWTPFFFINMLKFPNLNRKILNQSFINLWRERNYTCICVGKIKREIGASILVFVVLYWMWGTDIKRKTNLYACWAITIIIIILSVAFLFNSVARVKTKNGTEPWTLFFRSQSPLGYTLLIFVTSFFLSMTCKISGVGVWMEAKRW